MKNLMYIAFISLIFISCKENDEEEDKVLLGTYNFTSMEEEHQAYTSRGKIEDMEGFPDMFKEELIEEIEGHNEALLKFNIDKDSIYFINDEVDFLKNFKIDFRNNEIYIQTFDLFNKEDVEWSKIFDIESDNTLSTTKVMLTFSLGEFEDDSSNKFNVYEIEGDHYVGDWDIFDDKFNLRIANIQPDEFIALTKRKRYYKKQ